MIERGQYSKAKVHDDPIPCPNCGSPLTYTNGTRKCTSCEYELSISEIDYTQRDSRLCMICGNFLSETELQICQRCKDKISNNWRKQNEQ